MAVPTEPRQPVTYDMMLLADSLVALREFLGVGQCHPQFCERQKNLEIALSKIRCLAEFLSGKGSTDLIKVTDPEFSGVADESFREDLFRRISKFVSHLTEQRYKKESKYPQPKATEAIDVGKQLLQSLKAVMDPHKHTLNGDAAHWYAVFEQRYDCLMTPHD